MKEEEKKQEFDVKVDIYNEKLIVYIKIILIAILVITEIFVCAQTGAKYVGRELMTNLLIVVPCCVLLAVIETIDSFVIKNFAAKMVFYAVDALLLLIICIFTGNSLLSTLYCVVLTQIYINIERFRDKLILFIFSCALYVTSFVVGWVLTNRGETLATSAIQIASGAFLGLLILSIDFIVVQFSISFYRNNKKLTAALKEADESKAALQAAYEELSKTAVFEERNRIAKDIHDNAGHSMTTVIMQTEAAKLLIDKDPQEAKARIISANIQAKNALDQMRESVHLLAGRTGAKPLREQFEEIIAQTIDGTDVKVRCDIDDIPPLEAGAERFLCNSLKECLANGLRHGGATAFYIELKAQSGRVNFLVSDNGSGTEEIKEGFGLSGIKDGAAAHGGECSFGSEPMDGFETKISLPQKADKEG